MDNDTDKIILALTNKNILLEQTLRDMKRYLEAGPIRTRDDRDFCILKINLALDDSKPIKL